MPLGPGGRARRLEFAFHSTSSAALFSLNESPLLPPLFSYRSLSHSLGFRNRGKLFFRVELVFVRTYISPRVFVFRLHLISHYDDIFYFSKNKIIEGRSFSLLIRKSIRDENLREDKTYFRSYYR